MQTEQQCKPSERYLFAESYFSDKAIEIWKKECIARCKDKKKSQPYDTYINWQRQTNEIAVFTLYAYSDFSVPKQFDVIFELDNPSNFIKTNYQLTQSIHEAWFPSNIVDDGHKHLCVFKFESSVPEILMTLHKQDDKFSDSLQNQKMLGFCNSNDFEEITRRRQKIVELKKLHGKNWYEYDT